MLKKNKNLYYDDFLQFYIEKPKDWFFIPQNWAANFKEKILENNQAIKEKLKNAMVPFVYFYKPHGEPEYPLPTVQCSCRLNCIPPESTLEEGIQKIIEALTNSYSELDIIEANVSFILSGYRSIFIRMKFSMNNLDNQPIQCLGRVIMAVTPKIIYNIGMTGSLAEKYQCEDTFKEITHSIKFGNKYLRQKEKLLT